MAIPQKIHDFLVARIGSKYCDDCIRDRLGLRWRQQVQLITSTLAVTGNFLRADGVCSNCHQTKQVVSATVPRAQRGRRISLPARKDEREAEGNDLRRYSDAASNRC